MEQKIVHTVVVDRHMAAAVAEEEAEANTQQALEPAREQID